MINIVYLVIFLVAGDGVTSQSIPQANMNQCNANARLFNTGSPNRDYLVNGHQRGARTQKALCLVGVK